MNQEAPAPAARIRSQRISQVLAHARNGTLDSSDVPTPSLDSPTRPKTPASFDDHSFISHHQHARANSRSRSLATSSFISRHIRLESIENTKPNRSQNAKLPSTDMRSSASLAKIPDCAFNSQGLCKDLEEIEGSIGLVPALQTTDMLAEPCGTLITFLKTLKSDSEVDNGK